MATSTTSLVYALPIRASDLIAAARVYSKIGPTSLGLSLAVRSLKQHNVLPSWLGAEVPAINRVPVEVWEMIRQELIDLEVVDVRGEVVSSFECPVCTDMVVDDGLHEELTDLDESKTLKQLRQESRDELMACRKKAHKRIAFNVDWVDGVYSLHDDGDCDFGADLTYKWREFTNAEIKKKAIAKVLAPFGLMLPSTEVFHSKQDDLERSDSVILIAADLEKHEGGSAVPAKCVVEVDRHGINNTKIGLVPLGAKFFDKHDKLNLDNRFTRFCATYSVTPHHLPKPPKPVTPPAAAAGAGAPPAAGAPTANAAATAAGRSALVAVGDDEINAGDVNDEKEEGKLSAGWMILNELTRK